MNRTVIRCQTRLRAPLHCCSAITRTTSVDPDARLLLEVLGYAEFPADVGKSGSEARHSGRLLMAASQFVRVFELAAPDAPGLVCFGAEIDPAMADPLHAGSPAVSVSGVGLSPREAFQGCIGEGIEYLSQLQTGNDVLERSPVGDPAARLGSARELLTALSAHRLRPDLEFSWHRAMRLGDHREVLLPADLCLRRPMDQRETEPPFLLGTGSAAGKSWNAAALHGMLELIERDATSLWWRGGVRGGQSRPTMKLTSWPRACCRGYDKTFRRGGAGCSI